MISRFNSLYLSASLALSVFVTQPIMADEANKKIEFEFAAPVQIPGHVLAPGKYVFELMDTAFSDRNMVQIFSEDSNGKEILIATISAIPDYTSNTPEKATIHFEERHSGAPEAIHSWYYPGDDTGWEFVYPKGQSLETAANTTSASAPVVTAAAAAPSTPAATDTQQVQQKDPVSNEPISEAAAVPVEEQTLVAQNDAPASPPAQEADIQTGPTEVLVLPQTGGNSDLELMIGFAMLGGGLAALFAWNRKSLLAAGR
jgi:LPXTG-motif cell wall-anchored protein